MANIQDIRQSRVAPQRAYEFGVEILGNSATGTLPILETRVLNANIPSTSVDTIVIPYKSQNAQYAGRDSSSHTANVTFWCDEDMNPYIYFKDWMENAINNSLLGGGMSRDLYSVDMVIKQFAHDSETVTMAHRLTHVWPTEIGEISLSMESSEHAQFDVTFSFDANIPQQG